MSPKAFIVFPGQGSQFPGMGKSYFENFSIYRKTLEEASDASGLHLKKLSFDSTESEIKESSIAQPLILSTSVAMWRVLTESFGLESKFEPIFAGHSLGEYTALVASGYFEFVACVKAVQERGRFMSEAVAPGIGGMRALILKESVNEARLKSLCDYATLQSGKLVALANWNTDTQVVLSGYEAGLKAVDTLVGTSGEGFDFKWARKSIALPVSGPFHSPLMEKAREAFSPVLQALKFTPQTKKYIRNVDAHCAPQNTEETVKSALDEQVCGSVRWYPSLLQAKEEGCGFHIEISPSKVLSNMAARIETFKEWKFLHFEDPLKIEEVLR